MKKISCLLILLLASSGFAERPEKPPGSPLPPAPPFPPAPPICQQIDVGQVNNNANKIFADNLNQDCDAAGLFADLDGPQLNAALTNSNPSKIATNNVALMNSVNNVNQVQVKSAYSKMNNDSTGKCAVKFEPAKMFEELVASNSDEITSLFLDSRRTKNSTYGLSFNALGNYSHLKAQSINPGFDAVSGGAALAFEYYGFENGLIGTSLNYIYTNVCQDYDLAESDTHQGIFSLYGIYTWDGFYANFSINGGYNDICNDRNISFPGFKAVAKSSFNNWQILPFLELGYDFIRSWGGVEPYLSLAYVGNWQECFTEKGAGVLNMVVDDHYSSQLRTELGLRFYDVWEYDWGWFFLKETIGYINKQFYDTGELTAGVVGGTSFFTTNIATRSQDLASFGLETIFVPGDRIYPYVSLAYIGEVGKRFQSHTGLLRVIKKF